MRAASPASQMRTAVCAVGKPCVRGGRRGRRRAGATIAALASVTRGPISVYPHTAPNEHSTVPADYAAACVLRRAGAHLRGHDLRAAGCLALGVGLAKHLAGAGRHEPDALWPVAHWLSSAVL